MKKRITAIFAALIMLLLSACNSDIQKNSVLSPDDIPGSDVGVISMSAGESYLKQSGSSEVTSYTDSEELAADLKSGKLDCAVMSKDAGESLADKEHKLKLLDEAYVDEAYSIITAKENADLAEAINDALTVLTEDGTLTSIIESYTMDTGYIYECPEEMPEKDGSITLSVSPDFPPYEYKDKEGNIRGLDIDIATAICDVIGVNLEIVEVTETQDEVSMVQSGEVVMAMGRFQADQDGLDIVDVTEPYFTSQQVIIVRKR